MLTAAASPARLPGLLPSERAALDDDGALAGHTRWTVHPDGTREGDSVFSIQGMHCAACAGVIEAALLGVHGVQGANVHAASERARVRWNPALTSASALVDTLRRAGYAALPAPHEAARLQRQKESRAALWRLFVAGFCMMQVMMVTAPLYFSAPGEIPADQLALLRWSAWILTLPLMAFSAGPFFSGAWRSLRHGRIGMDVPVALGMAITFIAGTASTFDPAGPFGHDLYLDSLAMFATFLLAGRWLEKRARDRSRDTIESLLQRLPDSAERLDDQGGSAAVGVSQLRIGDRVRVPAGQSFPGDGEVQDGTTQVDEALITGESRPVPRGPGDAVLAGSVNAGSPVVVRLTRLGDDTRHGQIVRLLEQAMTQRPSSLRLADRVAGPFLIAVLLLAGGAGWAWSSVDPARAVSVAVAVLIVTCPCALSLAGPAAWLAAAGGLARRGVLVQRFEALEALAQVDTVCFDKTGTLTCDTIALGGTRMSAAADGPALLGRAASLAALSSHPLSQSLVAALPASTRHWTDVREVAGSGIEARDTDGRVWRLGAPAWVGVRAEGNRPQVACGPRHEAPDEQLLFWFDEVLRPDAAAAVAALAAEGLALRMLSGDGEGSARTVAARVGIGDVLAGATPDDKLAELARLQTSGHRVAMVGDGLNDGPVLARADVSFAMAHGSALAQQRADFVLLGSRLEAVPSTHRQALRMARVMRQNLAWAAAYNAACVPLALLGYLPPWAAGAGMAASSLLVVLNALRLAR